MPEKNPETYAFLTYLWVFILATFGGVVSYLNKLKNGKKWNAVDFMIDVTTAVFVGVTIFFLCEYAGFSQVFTAALVSIGGRYSDRAVKLFGKILDRALGAFSK